jgi:hypothetical protein
MSKYKLTLELDDWAGIYGNDGLTLESKIIDLIKVAILPTLSLEVSNYQFTKKRG